ncbi:MAG: hypothetical protein AAGA32_09375 [Pseudomonadota bacterium]
MKEFDQLSVDQASSQVFIQHATLADLSTVYPPPYARQAKTIASLATCFAMSRRHRDNIWSIFDTKTTTLRGFYAMLMLSSSGLTALLNGRFLATMPDAAHTASTGDPIAGIYKWGVFAPGRAAGAIPQVAVMLRAERFARANLYGTAATPAGERIMRSLGFGYRADPKTPDLLEYVRMANRPGSQTNHDQDQSHQTGDRNDA